MAKPTPRMCKSCRSSNHPSSSYCNACGQYLPEFEPRQRKSAPVTSYVAAIAATCGLVWGLAGVIGYFHLLG
jgi:hypothetical protein